MRKLLFLDVDGVLNDINVLTQSPPIGNRQMQNLRLATQETNCEIVLSSTWRVFQLNKRWLQEAFQKYNIALWIDQTPEIHNAPRSKEIIAWLLANAAQDAKVVVLDDDDDANIQNHGLFNVIDSFIQTDFKEGLTANHSLQVIDFFNSKPN